MEIIKKINNNVALGIKNGKECIVFGRGVGFNKTPYILVNEEIIEKIFYDIDARLLDGLTEIHVDVLDVILKIYDDAVARLELDISPNFIITLSDHIQFAIKKKEMGIETPVLYSEDIKYIYQKLYDFSIYALTIINETLKVDLPYSEAGNITLHLINNIQNIDTISPEIAKALLDIIYIIEKRIGKYIDKDTYEYYRFISHLRLLILREPSNRMNDEMISELYNTIFNQSKFLKAVLNEIEVYFSEKLNKELNHEEIIYLSIYLNRLLYMEGNNELYKKCDRNC